jgi:GNAT superfamily N-acetyltransferase
MSWRIGRATARDVADILRLIRALARYEKLSRQVVATRAALRKTLFGRKPAAEVLIARAGTRAVGFALFFHNYSTFLARPGIYLEDLYVEPKWRGHGIGEGLLRAVARTAVRRGCGRFEWSVLDWNKPAIGFYRKLGARPLDDWTVMRLTGAALKKAAMRD